MNLRCTYVQSRHANFNEQFIFSKQSKNKSPVEVNVDEKQIKCDFCDDFEASSPFDIITHLKECHVENQTLKNGLQSQKRSKKGGNKSKEKIPIVRLKRNLLKLVEKIPIDIYS